MNAVRGSDEPSDRKDEGKYIPSGRDTILGVKGARVENVGENRDDEGCPDGPSCGNDA